jgi:predicted nucleic acid-binding protein
VAVFLDTSARAKLYHREIGTEIVERIVDGSPGQCFISRLGVLEMQSVLARKERADAISADESGLARRKFRWDLRRRQFRVVALRVRHYELAEALLGSYGAVHGLRTLDSLQLAGALDLYRNQLIDSMVTADQVLCRVAPREGLTALDPEA